MEFKDWSWSKGSKKVEQSSEQTLKEQEAVEPETDKESAQVKEPITEAVTKFDQEPEVEENIIEEFVSIEPSPVESEKVAEEQVAKQEKETIKEIISPTINVEDIVDRMTDAIQRELYNNIESMMTDVTQHINGLHRDIASLSNNQKQLYFNQAETLEFTKSLKDNLVNVIEQQETTIQKQHNAALKFQEDVIFKVQKNLIMELINISDNIRMILQDHSHQPNYNLQEAVEGLNKWVNASLENNSIKKFRDTDIDDKALDRKRQEVIDRGETDDETKDGSYVSEQPGYTWSIPYLVVNSEVQLEKILSENKAPKMFSFVIRPEQVIKLKYNKNQIIED